MPDQCLLWHRADQAELLKDAVADAGLEVEVVGTPERGRASALASMWPARAADDLRAELAAAEDIRLAILADTGVFGEDPADAAAVEMFIRRGGRVLTFEPLPPTVHAVTAGWGANIEGVALSDIITSVGSPHAGSAVREALVALEQFGPLNACAVSCTAGPGAGSLGARLLSAMELLYTVAGEPEHINAALAQPREQRSSHPDRLGDLHGTLTCNVRFADQRAATVLVSDRSAPWHRGLTILGDAGRMRVWDEGFVWTGPDGRIIDEHRVEPARAVQYVSAAIGAALGPLAPRVHATTVLAMAEAALLSARTGSAESPATLRRAASRL